MGKKSHRTLAHESCINPPRKPLIRFCPVHDGALPDEDKCPVCHHVEKYRAWQRRAVPLLEELVPSHETEGCGSKCPCIGNQARALIAEAGDA